MSARSMLALLVEEDPLLLGVLTDAVRHQARFVRVRQVGDPAEALTLLASGPVPDLVALDLDHADRRARLVLELLRSQPRFAATAVVVAGDAANEPAREPWLAGEVWVPRPFPQEELATAVQLALLRAAEARPARRTAPAGAA